MHKSYTKRDVICRFPLCEAHDFRRTSLTCPQIKSCGNRRVLPSLLEDIETSRRLERRNESPGCLNQGYVIGINDCKQRARVTKVIRAADSRRALQHR